MNRLAGKIAIVTGGASGMGAAQARLFCEEGARVVIADVSDAGETVAKEIGENAAFFTHDVSNKDSWEKLVAFTTSQFGAPSILVNTAGIANAPTPLTETSEEDFDRIYRVNQRGIFLGMQAVAQPMKAAGKGAIVNIASVGALAGAAGMIAYTSSKAAVRLLTKTAAVELGALGIRVNTILPGATNTAINSPELTKLFEEHMAPRIPLSRMAEPEEIANATLFLACDEASYITGADLVVDGGFSA